MTTTTHTGHGVRSVLTLTEQQIAATPWTAVVACEGVFAKELWRHGDLVCALLRYEPGADTPGVPHAHADQHLWVVEGEATVAGRRLPAGSYIHVPPGTPHPIHATGPLGCVLLQSHVHALADTPNPVTAGTCQQ